MVLNNRISLVINKIKIHLSIIWSCTSSTSACTVFINQLHPQTWLMNEMRNLNSWGIIYLILLCWVKFSNIIIQQKWLLLSIIVTNCTFAVPYFQSWNTAEYMFKSFLQDFVFWKKYFATRYWIHSIQVKKKQPVCQVEYYTD